MVSTYPSEQWWTSWLRQLGWYDIPNCFWKVIIIHNPFHGSSHHQPVVKWLFPQWIKSQGTSIRNHSFLRLNIIPPSLEYLAMHLGHRKNWGLNQLLTSGDLRSGNEAWKSLLWRNIFHHLSSFWEWYWICEYASININTCIYSSHLHLSIGIHRICL